MINSMRDSGVEWIGDIPSDWEAKKLRYLVKLRSGKGSIQDNDKYIGLENIESNTGRLLGSEKKVNDIQNDIFYAGDVLFGKLRPYLRKVWRANFDGVASSEFLVFYNSMLDSNFLFWSILSDNFIENVDSSTYGAKMPRANWDYIKNIFIPVPPIKEQKAIANFLDEETKKLDDTKSLLQQQIEKLKEYRKSLIWETVTKGLDKTVPMKDSGVDWIGEIPEEWGIKPIKYIYETIGSGTTPKSDQAEFYDGDIHWIQSGDLYQVDEVIETTKTITELGKRSSTALKIYEAPFLSVAMYGASVGNLAISKINATVNQAVAVMKDNNSKVYFGKYALEASKQELINAALGGTQPNISQMLLRSWNLPQPDVEIQMSIAKFLDEKTVIIEKIISNIQSQIEIIDKQRKTLIYDYVTGKRRVQQ